VINRITGGHLDFYYRRMLRLEPKGPVPDKAHVLLELKKNAPPIEIGPGDHFSAGKDASGKELIYEPSRTTIINSAKIDSLRSIFVDSGGRGDVRCAPIANSSDGAGGELKVDNPRWSAFGGKGHPAAQVGFALASPVLRMKEGLRSVTLSLTLGNAERLKRLTPPGKSPGFDVFLTGEKGWLGPYVPSLALKHGNVLDLRFTLGEGEKGVVDYDPAVHGHAYAAHAPIAQVLLKAGAAGPAYGDLSRLILLRASVAADVANVGGLHLQSDAGAIDPKKAFFPFGAQPSVGSRFVVGCDEALAKKLSELSVTVEWKAAPRSFSARYENYGSKVSNTSFTSHVSFHDGGSWNVSEKAPLFESADASLPHTFVFRPRTPSRPPSISEGMRVFALNASGTEWGRRAMDRRIMVKPVLLSAARQIPEPETGLILFTLARDFLHEAYRTKYVEHVLTYSKEGGTLIVLNEPYTPAIQSIRLSYSAYSDDVPISAPEMDDYSNPDIQFFHVGCFGQMREHGYQRKQFPFLSDTRVTLLPFYPDAGEFLIGLTNVTPADSVSILFQVAEGSENPDLESPDIVWSVLCDNYWKPLGQAEVVLDTTNRLRTSGLITFVIPVEATTTNTILPTGHIWIKAATRGPIGALCEFIDVAANAIEVRFQDHGNDEGHLASSLEEGSITSLKKGLAAVKTVKQPYPSFGGRQKESDRAFNTRVSERLRHKDRCVTPWDYERTILEAFPAIHKVKCIPHATRGSWLAPGQVMIVVIPDLTKGNAFDILQPKVGAETISRITQFVQDRAGMQVGVTVKNPAYQRIQLDFTVGLHRGYEFNYYSVELNKAIVRFLSPWAFASDRDIGFGGKVYRSVLLDFVEELAYVDYVTGFRMYVSTGQTANTVDVSETRPVTPDAILVSAQQHLIKDVGD
jgi:hypothetical protein